MSFADALLALSQGLIVRRQGWRTYWKTIEDARGEQQIAEFHEDGQIQFNVQTHHLFAHDWELYVG